MILYHHMCFTKNIMHKKQNKKKNTEWQNSKWLHKVREKRGEMADLFKVWMTMIKSNKKNRKKGNEDNIPGIEWKRGIL